MGDKGAVLASGEQWACEHQPQSLGSWELCRVFFTSPIGGLEPKAYGLAHFQECTFWRPNNAIILGEEGG